MKLQQGMTALVTGGVSGLGEASAIALLERGLNVVAVDLNDERGQAMEQQYAGRLHRYCAGKQDLRIYDYTDPHIPSLARIAEKRRKIWTDMGYRIQS